MIIGDGGVAVHPPLRAPNRARIRGAIDGGAIKLIKRRRKLGSKLKIRRRLLQLALRNVLSNPAFACGGAQRHVPMSRKDELLKLANFSVPKPGFGDPQSGTCEGLLTIIRAKPIGFWNSVKASAVNRKNTIKPSSLELQIKLVASR